MLKPDIEKLNTLFSIEKNGVAVEFKKGKGDVPVVEIKNTFANAVVSLQGAHLLSWAPHVGGELIWLSSDAKFRQGKSVRGGIPICWPWFGAHKSESEYPAHGFARTVFWQVVNVELLESGETLLVFELHTHQLAESLQEMWPTPSVAEYRVVIGNELTLTLITHNKSNENIMLSEALHTYFNVEDINQTRVVGLDDVEYLDKPDDFKRKRQVGDILINGEVDRVYVNSSDDVLIKTSEKNINIVKNGSQSTIVWNPGEQVAHEMGDLGKNGYLKMLCVESANAAENTLLVAPGSSHALTVSYQLS